MSSGAFSTRSGARPADRIAQTRLTAFTAEASNKAGGRSPSYSDLHRWSIEDRGAFWSLVWDFCGVVGDKGERELADGDRMPGARFFPDARLNFAENLLRHAAAPTPSSSRGEDKVLRRLSGTSCHAVSRLQQLFPARSA